MTTYQFYNIVSLLIGAVLAVAVIVKTFSKDGEWWSI